MTQGSPAGLAGCRQVLAQGRARHLRRVPSLGRTSNLGQFVAARCAANHALREVHKQSTVACELAARRPRPASTSAISSADGGEVNAGRSAGAVSAVAEPPTRRKVGVLLCLMAITSLQRFAAEPRIRRL